jgi:uncharacterized integral membrane protein
LQRRGADEEGIAMPAFLKSPKFIISAIIVAWIAYVIYFNSRLDPIQIKLLPFVGLQFNVSAVILGAMVVGGILTLWAQSIWRRWRASKNAPGSATAP